MNATCLRIEAVDTVSFRGNTGFSGGGTVGRSMMPPWPSTLSGALRSWILTSSGVLDVLRAGKKVPEGPIQAVLGEKPASGDGTFRVTDVGLWYDGRCWFPVPADLEVRQDAQTGALVATRLVPFAPGEVGAATSAALPMVPVLPAARPAKPVRDAWISSEGLRAHLEGRDVPPGELRRSGELWRSEFRVGVALDPALRSAVERHLFTTERLRLVHGNAAGTRWDDVELFVRVVGAGETLDAGPFWLRLGGDGTLGRARRLDGQVPGAPWEHAPPPDAGGFRIVMATPGLFGGGWLPAKRNGAGAPVVEIGGLKARIVCAAVPRGGAVSGWDVRNNRPKPLVRSVPAGAVYWCEVVGGSVSDLEKDRDKGLWGPDSDRIAGWRARRAEGFNSFWLGRWKPPPGR